MRSKKSLMTIFAFLFIMIGSIFLGTEVQAAGNYYAQVNKGTNVVTIFDGNGTPVKAFTCSAGQATPLGTFYTSNKYTWHVLDGNVYGQYCTRINGGVLFHSVWYYAQDKATQSYAQYNKLGTLASHGCVRLTVAASKWIYDNCASGMRVTIINGTAANDPLGKPETIKVDASKKMGWDPTDPDPANPYHASFPSINVDGVVRTVEFGGGFDPMSGVSAKSSAGTDITSSVTYTSTVNVGALGTYSVNYSVSDALGRTATASVNVQVVDTKIPSINGVVKNRKCEYNSKLDILAFVSATNATGANLTPTITTTVIYPGTTNEVQYRSNVITLSKLGTYTIKYRVVNPNNGTYTIVDSKVKVSDTKAPVIKGVASKKTVEYKKKLNLRSKVSAKLVSGKDLTSKIVVYVKLPGTTKWKKLSTAASKKYVFAKVGTYKVRYTSKNTTSKKEAAKVMSVKVQDTKAPVISGVKSSKTVEYKSNLNLISGVKAKLVSGKDITSKMTVSVKAPGASSYTKVSASTSKKYTFKKTGTYKVKFSAKNPTSKKEKTATMSVKVQDTKAPVISGVSTSKITKEYAATMNLVSGIKAKLVSGTDLTSKMAVSVKAPEKEYKKISLASAKAYRFTATGEYKIKVEAVNATSKKAASKVYTVKVQDTKAPVISGVSSETLIGEYGETVDLMKGVSANLVSGKDMTNDIVVSVQEKDSEDVTVLTKEQAQEFTYSKVTMYYITYSCINPTGGKGSSALLVVDVQNTETPVITVEAEELDTTVGEKVDLIEGVSAIAADGRDLKGQITIAVAYENDDAVVLDGTTEYTFEKAGNYIVTYTVIDELTGKADTVSIKVKVVDREETQTEDQTADEATMLTNIQTADQASDL